MPSGGGAATPAPGGGSGRFGLPRGRQPAAVDEGARHGTDGATQRRLSHAGGARPRPAPAAPTPPLIRQKDRQEGFPTCRALHVQSLSCLVKNGAGLEEVWRPAAAAGRGEDPCAAGGHLFPAAADR